MTDLKFKAIPSEIVTSASTGTTLVRGTSANLPYNQNLLKRLQAIVTDSSYDGNFFDDDVLQAPSLEDLQKLLTQVIIRFDNDPNYYTKRDYYHLIWYLCQSLLYLAERGASEQDLSDIYTKITQLTSRIDDVDLQLEGLQENMTLLSDNIYIELPAQFQDIYNKITELEQLLSKQDKLEEGTGIKIEDNIISARATESFKVSNVNIGGYTDGMIIDENTPILEILKTILQKVVDVKANAPSAKLTGDSYKAEYGSETTKTATVTLTQGSFTSADTTAWTTDQKMDCQLVGITDDWQWTISADGMSAVSTNKYVATSAQTFSVPSIQISKNTVVPKKSNNEDSSVLYDNTSLTVSGSVKVTPYYNLYFGPVTTTDVTSVTASDVKQLANTAQAEFPLAVNKTIGGSYTGQGKSILVACPSEYQLSGVTDSMGNSILSLFRFTSQLDVPCGNGVLVKYNLYLYPISTGADQAYKNLTFNLM